MVATPFVPLVENHPNVDEIIEFDRKKLGKMLVRPSAFGAFWKFSKALRKKRFDLVVDLQGLFRSGFFTWVTRAKRRIGFADARELSPMFYTERLPKRSADEHAVEHNYRVAEALGFSDIHPTIDLAITEDERARAVNILANVGLGEGTKFAAVLPSARWETKQWMPERFAKLIDKLHSEDGLQSVVMGAPDERGLCANIVKNYTSTASPIDLSGSTNLRELTAIIERAALVICHDSGPMHLAAALNRPMVSILGPTNPLRTGPYRRQDTVLRLDLECSPCYLRRLSQCRNGHACMQDLPVGKVYERVQVSLDRKAPSADETQWPSPPVPANKPEDG